MNVAVLIPAYNAAHSLPALLERTAAIIPRKCIFVVNDGSHDATGENAKTFSVNLIDHDENKGKGGALQTGFNVIMQQGFEAVITMDADLQHRPEDIPRFLDLYNVTHNDVIIGSRLHNKKGMPFHRILSNTITTALVKIRTGVNITDSQSGFRFIMRRVLEKVQLQSTGFEAETEFLIKAASSGFSFGSLPIDTIYSNEKSTMTHFATTINFLKVLLKQY